MTPEFDPAKMMDAAIQFGDVHLDGLHAVVAFGAFDGRIFAGTGDDTKAAVEDLIHNAMPDVKTIETAHGAAWHPIFKPGTQPKDLGE